MALVLADRVKETTTTTGTGTVTLAGVSAGYQSFAAIGDGNTTYYTISGQTTSEWEVGIGTYTSSGTTLSRTTVLSSSNGGSLVNFSAGTKDVFVTYPSGRSVNADAANTVVSVPQLSATSITDSGNLTFTGTGNRITGDFSNATFASRVVFQTSTVNGATQLSAIPNGTGTVSTLQLYNNSDIANSSRTNLAIISTEARLSSDITGTGTYLPMTFYTGGSERMRLDTSGNVGIGTTTPTALRSTNLEVYNASGASVVVGTASTSISTLRLARKDATDGWDINYNFPVASMLSFNKLGTNAGPLFNIDSAGNVGIGQTSPQAKLQTSTAADGAQGIFSGAQSTNEQTLLFRNSYYTNNATAGVAAIGWIDSGSSGGNLTFKTGVNGGGVTNIPTEKVRIDQAGNVGIGNSSPSAKLDVTGGIKVSGQLMAGTSGSIYSPLVSAGYVSGTSNIYIRNLSGVNRIDSYNDPITATYPFQLNASQIAFYIADGEKMRIDSSGNVGIGTSSPSNKLQVTDASFATIRLKLTANANGTIWNDNASTTDFTCVDARAMTFGTSNTERMRISSAGDVGIGTSSSAARLGVVNDQAALSYLFDTSNVTNGGSSLWRMITRNIANTGTTSVDFYKPSGTGFSIINNDTNASNFTAFNVGSSERMRIDSSGNLLVGRTGTDPTAATGIILTPGNTGAMEQSINTATNSNHYLLYNLNATNNGYRFYVNANGGIYNYSASNVNLSDRREKINFAPAGDYLSKICAIPVQTYNYIDQNLEEDGGLTLGVVAQDVQLVAPELVNESNWGTEEKPKMRLSIYQTDLQYALMKCIQEQQALITSLTARIEALEST